MGKNSRKPSLYSPTKNKISNLQRRCNDKPCPTNSLDKEYRCVDCPLVQHSKSVFGVDVVSVL